MSDRRMSINDIRLPPNIVKGLPTNKLESLNEQDENFLEFFANLDLDNIKDAQRRRKELQEKNEQLAQQNCDLEPRFEERKEELRRKCIEAGDLKEEYVRRYGELKTISSQSDSSAVLKDLQKAGKDSEQSAEDLAEKFLGGTIEMTSENFVKEFFKLRTQHWVRKVKAEKMDELVRNKQPKPMPRSPRIGRATESIPPPYLAPLPPPAHSLPTASPPGHPPYPVAAPRSNPAQSLPPYQGMPQPGHPFPAAAFTSYHPQPPPSQYPRQPPPRPAPYASRPPYPYH